MALLDMGTADGSAIGNPTIGNYFIFLDSNNNDLLTTRDENGIDTLYESGGLNNRVIVTQSNYNTTLGGTIDSTKEYFLDGVIDMGAFQITVPSGGINIKGFDFNVSGLTSSENTYTMFTGATSGDVLLFDFKIEVTGTSSQVFDLTNSSGFNAFEISRINFNGCTSLGELNGYRQGLETGTGRFGGTPNLILSGTWLGGYFIDTSIVRSLTAGAYSIYEAGTAFLMNSRFRSNQNIDLPSTASFIDFGKTNFANPSTVQIKGAIISRNGSFNASDTNIFTNLNPSDLPCDWDNNIGIKNTFVGGALNNTTEVQTTIVTQGSAVDLNGTFTSTDLQHFDSPSNGRLRHLGTNPTDFLVSWDFVIDGKDNDNYELFLIKIDSLANVTVEFTQVRTVNNFQGGRDVGIWSGTTPITLNQNDVVFWQVANLLDDDNCTLEIDSTWTVTER